MFDNLKEWNEKRKKEKNTFFSLTVTIKTPKGCATRASKFLKPIILGGGVSVFEVKDVNGDDSVISWRLNKVDSRRMMSINRNVVLFDVMITKILGNKRMKKLVDADQLGELEDMLRNHTSIELDRRVFDGS
jgi:hypothetical protein